jgi:hypothetical protein
VLRYLSVAGPQVVLTDVGFNVTLRLHRFVGEFVMSSSKSFLISVGAAVAALFTGQTPAKSEAIAAAANTPQTPETPWPAPGLDDTRLS